LIPYHQGELDGLCAVYCIINATKIISNTSKEECQILFNKIINFLSTKQNISPLIIEGIHCKTVSSIFRQIQKNMIHKHERPFRRRKKLTLDEYWNKISMFLSEPRRIVLIGIEGVEDHWTVVTSITKRQMNLFDNEMKRLCRGKCTLLEPTKKRPYKLNHKMTYFLS
jgi:hypothetical protein